MIAFPKAQLTAFAWAVKCALSPDIYLLSDISLVWVTQERSCVSL